MIILLTLDGTCWLIIDGARIFSAGCVVFLQLENSDFVGSMAIYIFL